MIPAPLISLGPVGGEDPDLIGDGGPGLEDALGEEWAAIGSMEV